MVKFRLSAFSDEYSASLDEQIEGLILNKVRMTEVRGVDGINVSDLTPLQAAEAHRKLGGYETLFLPSLPELSRLSSTIVRDCASHRASLNGMVPEEIIDEVYAVYAL